MYSFFFLLFVMQINCHIISQSLFSSFISILFLNYNKVCSTTATRQDFLILVSVFSILQVEFPHVQNISTILMLSLYPSSPTSQLVKSHACFEARSNKHYQEKYTECTYKHKNYLYIFIYKIHSKRMGRQLCTNEAPVVNEQTNQTKDKWKKPGRWGKTWDQN